MSGGPGDGGLVKPVDDLIGQRGCGPRADASVLTRADRRRIKVIVGVATVIRIRILDSMLAHRAHTTIEGDTSVTLTAPHTHGFGYDEMFIIADHEGFFSRRVGNYSAQASSGTTRATFTVSTTGTHGVTGGISSGSSSTFRTGTVELTRDDDGGVVEVRPTM